MSFEFTWIAVAWYGGIVVICILCKSLFLIGVEPEKPLKPTGQFPSKYSGKVQPVEFIGFESYATIVSPCSSVELERLTTNQEVAGSNPARDTKGDLNEIAATE